MADELQYASGANSAASNKRKFEDQTMPSPVAPRPTGFSVPISSQSPPASYNSVPPPVDDIELAKRKAQEIAARLLNSSADAKRTKFENGSFAFDSTDTRDLGQKSVLPSVVSSMAGSYGYPASSKKIEIPNDRVGVVIGKAGETIKYLQVQSGAKIQVTRDADADLNFPTRSVELTGTVEAVEKAEQLINEVLAEAEAGSSGIVSRRLTGQQGGTEQFVMKVPNNKVGLVIGKGGGTIKNMQARSGARIQVIPLHLPPGDTLAERTLQIDGSSEQIEAAKQLVNEVLSENRLRNAPMAEVYPHQYQARPLTNWAPPGPQMHQPGYAYFQPGAYPGPSPQYNMAQTSYPSNPQPTSSGFPTGWEQTTAAPNQQSTQGGGYDYYQQQQSTGGSAATTDNPGYGYSQPPASGYNQQGYPQDCYVGYHTTALQAGYQAQPNPVPGYDQLQGCSSTTAGYSNVANPTSEGQTPSYGPQDDTNQASASTQSSVTSQQGHNAGQQSSSNPIYLHQGSAQPGYGMIPPQTGYGTLPPSGYGPNYGPPPVSQPAYGQPQHSPSAQGGYGQPAPLQPGYPRSQPQPAQSGYAQPDSGAQQAPPSSYGMTQPGYGRPPYGVPSVAQPSYGQQQSLQYNGSDSSGYAQPPVYSANGNLGGSACGTYNAASASQGAQPSGMAKTSPQS